MCCGRSQCQGEDLKPYITVVWGAVNMWRAQRFGSDGRNTNDGSHPPQLHMDKSDLFRNADSIQLRIKFNLCFSQRYLIPIFRGYHTTRISNVMRYLHLSKKKTRHSRYLVPICEIIFPLTRFTYEITKWIPIQFYIEALHQQAYLWCELLA